MTDMKKHLYFLTLTAALLSFAACSKSDEQDVPDKDPAVGGDMVERVFGVSCEGNEMTRTSIGSGMAVEWLASDKIAVFDGTSRSVFSVKECNGASASFEGQVSKTATEFYAAYPANLATAVSDGVIATEIPAVQVVPAGKNVGDGALVAVAYTTGETLAFKNVCSLFKVTLTDTDITSVTISAMGGEALAGACNVTVSATPSMEFTEGVSSVTMKAEDGSFAAGSYYIAVAPGSYTGGLSVVLTHSADSQGGLKQGSDDVSVVRNNGCDLGTVSASECTWGTFISNLSELREWSKSGDFSVPAILGADIEVGEWSPYYRATAFTSVFYGLGHKLYNITCEPTTNVPCAFLYQPANVRDLYVGTKDGLKYDGVSKFTLGGGSTNGYCALFAYSKDGGEYDRVVNFATFEVSTAHGGASWVRVGAFVGAVNGGTFKNCRNYGTVSCKAQTTAAETGVGGFFGFVDQNAGGYTARLIDCENHGLIENYCPRAQYIGGFYGRTGHTGNVNPMKEITRCRNYGDIKVYAGLSPLRVGGICAEAFYILPLSYCENHGNIESCFTATNLYMAGIAAEISGDAKDATGDQSVVLDHCSNAGNITVGEATFLLEGGLTGYSKNVSLKNCTNSGAITLNASAEKTNRYDVGGIVAYGTDVIRVDGCENTGAVSASGNTTGDISAGGVMGDTYWVKFLKNNTNRGNVSASNVGSGRVAAGGIMGSDFQGTGNNGNWTEMNKNYGPVNAAGATAYAGGVYGYGSRAASWGDYNYGAITGSVAANTGSLMGFSGYKYVKPMVGGSVNGTALSSSNWTGYIVGSSSTGEYQSGSGAGGFVTQ